jgi:hypothetical protein
MSFTEAVERLVDVMPKKKATRKKKKGVNYY